MSLNFIQKRLAYLDSYMKGIDLNFKKKLTNRPRHVKGVEKKDSVGFEDILKNKLAPKEKVTKAPVNAQTTFKAKAIKDDFSKLPDDFEDFLKATTKEISNEYNVKIDANLVKSVIKQESGFNPNARSHAGAQGLMQLMPSTAKSLGVFNSTNPYQNLRGGVTYLAQQLKSFDGDIQKALAAYNAGPTAVSKYQGVPPYQETQSYVENIMRDYLAREDYQSFDLLG